MENDPCASKGTVLLNRYLTRHGNSQRKLAVETGIEESLLSKYNLGKRRPKFANRELLETKAGIPKEAWDRILAPRRAKRRTA